MITIKNYDHDHLNRADHSSDRFNREIVMQPGWNDIDLDDVKNAPAERVMDMEHIAGLIFLWRKTSRRLLFILTIFAWQIAHDFFVKIQAA